jgi:hypothetical protein
VKTFYSKVRGIDSVSPTNAAMTLTSNSPVPFAVTNLVPRSKPLAVRWQLNGTPIANATNDTFILDPSSMTNGTYQLRAIVHDDTDWVRNDPGALLYSTNVWTVTLAAPQLWLESPQMLAGGKFRFTVRGTGVTNFSVRASTNFTSWTSISTNTLIGGQFNFTNTPGMPLRYYRAVAPPQ